MHAPLSSEKLCSSVASLSVGVKSPYHSLTVARKLLGGSCDLRNRTAIVKIGVTALNGIIGNHVGHEHSPVKKDLIGTRRNAHYHEFLSQAVITDTAGPSFLGNQMQLPAP